MKKTPTLCSNSSPKIELRQWRGCSLRNIDKHSHAQRVLVLAIRMNSGRCCSDRDAVRRCEVSHLPQSWEERHEGSIVGKGKKARKIQHDINTRCHTKGMHGTSLGQVAEVNQWESVKISRNFCVHGYQPGRISRPPMACSSTRARWYACANALRFCWVSSAVDKWPLASNGPSIAAHMDIQGLRAW